MESHSWQLTIVLLEGLSVMRPEKVWRPIVSIEVDKYYIHEAILGVDGQSINQRERFIFHDASLNSEVDIHVWHQSQSKKKKRRTLVASATHCLGELMKKQEVEQGLEIRLQCQTADQKAPPASRGRPQKDAVLQLILQPPLGLYSPANVNTPACSPVDSEASSWLKEGEELFDDSSYMTTKILTSNSPTIPPTVLKRRRKAKGYAIDTDDDCVSTSYSYSSENEVSDTRPLHDDNSYSDTYIKSDEEDSRDSDSKPGQLVFRRSSMGEIISFSMEDGGWVSASSDVLLPRYTDSIGASTTFTRAEKVVAALTVYGDLFQAVTKDEFEAIFKRLQYEWTYIGSLLVALAAVDTAVFSISHDSIFVVNAYARAAIATSSISSGLGIVCDAWFLLRYSWADVSTFATRARDIFGSYFFFSVSARMPAFCMFVASVSLLCFFGLVVFDVFRVGMLFMCFVVGIVMGLQFLVFSALWCVKWAAQGVRAGRAGILRVVTVVRSMTR